MKLVSAIYNSYYPFDEWDIFSEYAATTQPDDLTKGSCLVVWGGSDISPSLYNKSISSYTRADNVPSRRDEVEWELMKRAKEMGLPIIGICRGAQMLCALAGGFLIQDVTNHTQEHNVVTSEGAIIPVSSLHHQMMYPFEVDHELIAKSEHSLSEHYIDVESRLEVPYEPEFVYFPKERGIAIQWHPEFMGAFCQANRYVKEKVKKYVD